jgi:hypothetical protein
VKLESCCKVKAPTVSIASKQNMLFTVPLHVSSGYSHACISHCVMSCFDVCFWLVCLQLETKHVNTNCNALFQSVFFFFVFLFFFFFFCLPSDIHINLCCLHCSKHS